MTAFLALTTAALILWTLSSLARIAASQRRNRATIERLMTRSARFERMWSKP